MGEPESSVELEMEEQKRAGAISNVADARANNEIMQAMLLEYQKRWGRCEEKSESKFLFEKVQKYMKQRDATLKILHDAEDKALRIGIKEEHIRSTGNHALTREEIDGAVEEAMELKRNSDKETQESLQKLITESQHRYKPMENNDAQNMQHNMQHNIHGVGFYGSAGLVSMASSMHTAAVLDSYRNALHRDQSGNWYHREDSSSASGKCRVRDLSEPSETEDQPGTSRQNNNNEPRVQKETQTPQHPPLPTCRPEAKANTQAIGVPESEVNLLEIRKAEAQLSGEVRELWNQRDSLRVRLRDIRIQRHQLKIEEARLMGDLDGMNADYRKKKRDLKTLENETRSRSPPSNTNTNDGFDAVPANELANTIVIDSSDDDEIIVAPINNPQSNDSQNSGTNGLNDVWSIFGVDPFLNTFAQDGTFDEPERKRDRKRSFNEANDFEMRRFRAERSRVSVDDKPGTSGENKPVIEPVPEQRLIRHAKNIDNLL